MLRIVTLSLLIMVSAGVMIPIASSTHGLRQSSVSQQQRRYRRHSRAWWRRHRARLRARRAAAAAALARRQAALRSDAAHATVPLVTGHPEAAATERLTGVIPKLPIGWTSSAISPGEVKFKTRTNTPVPSHASLSVVARSRPNPGYLTHREQSRMLAGVAFSDLRRIVIDKMINAGGWVINDFERQVNGARVFVVIARTPADGQAREKAWNFYFAEADGKIYSLTLNSPVEFGDRLPLEGEKFLNSFAKASNAVNQ